MPDSSDAKACSVPQEGELQHTHHLHDPVLRILSQRPGSRLEILWNAKMRRPCVRKWLLGAAHSRSFASFQRSLSWMIPVEHPHLVQVYAVGRVGDDFFITMEYLQGMNLYTLLRVEGRIPPRRMVFLLSQVCLGLDRVHRSGTFHRDVKLSNLFLSEQGGKYDVVKLIDFGIAIAQEDMANMTHIPGTPAYLAPECFSGKGGGTAEIYALGVVFFQGLTGRLPFRAKTVGAYREMHEQQEPPLDWLQAVPGMIPPLVEVVKRALAKHPEHRYPSAHAMHNDLQRCQDLLGRWTPQEARSSWESLQQRGVLPKGMDSQRPSGDCEERSMAEVPALVLPHWDDPLV